MNRIRLLPEQVANQIAAGEVIERPVSVVKELVENALDAQARRITVEIQSGGRTLIRVTDDGVGMSRDDALLSLERHATSKIRCAEDLGAIATLGFRGEALPSIASVSRFTLTTRERDGGSPEATQIVVHGGKILEVRAAGAPPGTSVEVRQLFFNVPARRKFLRAEETEAAHIQHYLIVVALAFPEVAFTFRKDGRLIWQLPGLDTGDDMSSRLGAVRERLRALYGAGLKWVSVDFTRVITEEVGPEESASFETAGPEPVERAQTSLRVWGFIGAPGVSRATREDQHLYVNRRPVENRALNFALLEGYHTALMKGRYPVCCLFLELDPAAVDVNVHPAKREVKFHRENEVRRSVAEAVREALVRFHAGEASAERLAPAATPEDRRSAPPEVSAQSAPVTPPLTGLEGVHPTATPARPRIEQPALKMSFAPPREVPASEPLQPGMPEPPSRAPVGPSAPEPASPPGGGVAASEPAGEPALEAVPLLKVPLRLVGVIGRLYVVLESDRGLVLMDQHAAHERVLFEEMLERVEREGRAPSQKLLLPETIELPPREAEFLRRHQASLSRLGVGLSEFGERTFLLDALPPMVKASDARRFVLDVLDELAAAGREVNTARLSEPVIAKTVCRHAVKANDPLTGRELENLVASLRRCAMPYTCPHGRPTLVEISYRELEKKFGRAQ